MISQTARDKIMEEFSDMDQDCISVIVSIKILDECVDIPKCDSVFITYVGDVASDIRMVQRICRANRIDQSNPNKVASCFLWTDDLNKIVHSLQLLKDNDLVFNKKIRMINNNYDRNGDKTVIELIEKTNIKLYDYINIKCLSREEIWEYKKTLVFEYSDINETHPICATKYKDVNIGSWFNYYETLITDINSELYVKLSKHPIIKIKLDRYLKNREIINLSFDQLKDILFKYTVDHKKCPSKGTIYDGVKLGEWFGNQKK